MPLLDLLEFQVGTESTWGTGVTPTAKLMGVEDGTIDPGVTGEVFPDRRRSLGGGYLAALTSVMPNGKMDILGTYEDTPYYLDNLLGQATPSGSNPYTRAYSAPLGTAPSPRILTLVYGDATDCSQLAGALISKLVIKGENGGPMRMTADLIGKQESAGTLESLSDRTVNLVMGDHTALYVDTWGGTIGSTQISAAAFSYEITIDAKRAGQQFLGALTAGNWHEADGGDGWDGELKLMLELNSASRSVLTALRSSSTLFQRQVRITNTSGTNVVRFDFAGTSEKAPTLFTDRDGVVTFECTLKRTYNSGLANWFKAQVVNTVSSLA